MATKTERAAMRNAAKARAQMGKLQGQIEKRRTKIDRLQRELGGLEVEIHHLQNQLDRVKESWQISMSHLRPKAGPSGVAVIPAHKRD